MKKPLFFAISVLGLLPQLFASGPSGRQHILFDSDWKFLKGEIPGQTLIAKGIPIRQWKVVDDDNGPKDAAQMAGVSLASASGGWHEVKTGDDVFHGRVGFAWYRTILPPFKGKSPMVHFERVDDNGTIYLNGKYVDSHSGWGESFDVNLKRFWSSTGPNVLAVLVENTNGEGGITRPAILQDGPTQYTSGPFLSNYNDRNWESVHLPHDYIVAGTFSPEGDANHGSLPVSTGWYRKSFDLANSDAGKVLWLDFDGVYRDSMVWLNGHFLGRHASGYTSFRYDITRFAHLGGKNVLAVHVDPTQFEGWWYEGGGIYRHVWLNVADPVHTTPWGTYVSSELAEPKPNVPVSTATVNATINVTNDTFRSQTISVESRLVDDLGHSIAVATAKATIPPSSNGDVVCRFGVPHPRLWSLETPRLYRLVTKVKSRSHTLDSTETPFGIRTIRYDKDAGFFLNGKHVKIQGTCNHQDFIGVGIAVPDQLEAWRVKKLKEMGSNAWRMSHNPPTPELLDACDRLGMLVMDENRHLSDSSINLAEVANMVQRDRNHPSIIMWSMCNEEPAAGTETGGRIFKAMKAVVLKYDRTRPVSSAMNSGWFGNGFTNVEDLMGVNYNIEVYDRFHREHPAIPMFASETASTVTTRGEYADDRSRVAVSSYNMTDETWSSVAIRPFMAGSFVWTGFDYKGEPSPYGWPCINSHFGIMDMCGFPKDNYYYYQSWWGTKPVVHLLPHWNWPGQEGKDIRVAAFSNAALVELFVNGKSAGARHVPRFGHVEWNVKYAPGSIYAKAFDASGNVVATEGVATAGTPYEIQLRTDRRSLENDGEDVAVVEARVVDSKGRVVPGAGNRITFGIDGVGQIAGVGNGDPGDHDPDVSNRRRAFHGLCAVVIRGGDKAGKIHLSARGAGLKTGRLDFMVQRTRP